MKPTAVEAIADRACDLACAAAAVPFMVARAPFDVLELAVEAIAAIHAFLAEMVEACSEWSAGAARRSRRAA